MDNEDHARDTRRHSCVSFLNRDGVTGKRGGITPPDETTSPELAELIEYMETTPAAELDEVPSTTSFELSGSEFVDAVNSGGIVPASESQYAQAAAAGIGCSHTVNRPHYSNQAGGVIAKVRVECQIYGATSPQWIEVRMVGSITRTPDPDRIKAGVVATADYTQSVRTNNEEKTYYIPRPGQTAGTASGTYRACARITPDGGTTLATVCNSYVRP